MKRVCYWIKIYIWFIEPLYVKCAVRMLTHILIKVWEGSVTVPPSIPISYLPFYLLLKINRCIQMETYAHVLRSCMKSLSRKERLLWYFIALSPFINGKSFGFWDHRAVYVCVYVHACITLISSWTISSQYIIS